MCRMRTVECIRLPSRSRSGMKMEVCQGQGGTAQRDLKASEGYEIWMK